MAARAGFERFKHNPAGFRAILQSRAVQAVLDRKGRRVGAAITGRLEVEGWEVVTDTQVGRNRARTIVSGVPTRIEERDGILGSAIDAARGG